MIKCGQCGGGLRRRHRSFLEHFRYLAIYSCRECGNRAQVPRRYTFHLGPDCRCPRCGTVRVTRLKHKDRIDPMARGLLNLLEGLSGGKRLFHCRFCRLQFYDRRLPVSETRNHAHPPDADAVQGRA
ncbi:MAG TPA: hypothetical protein VJ732_14860 [Bryobacteraceae bacterium]|nr:hypothetical protein [Bryobacteraceae bacterium]